MESADQDLDLNYDTQEAPTPHTLIQSSPLSDPPHLDTADFAQLIEDAVTPLMESIDTLSELITEDPPGLAQLSQQLATAAKSIQEAITNIQPQNASSPDDPNISALKFQVAMCQPCNGNLLPAAVSHELDRLYVIEDAYATAAPAEKALTHLLDYTPVLIRLPTDPDDRLLTLALLNAWYKRARPHKEPLEAPPPNPQQWE